MSLFRTENLSIGYRAEKPLQRDINVSLAAGKIITLMGQNGVGKTTFLKTISKLLPPLSGSIYFGDTPLEQMNQQDLSRQLSLVLTERPSAPNMSVIELVIGGRHPFTNWLGTLSSEDEKIIEWALTETQINYIAEKRLSELSDGQLQKAMIARALAQKTNMIFLDEPTAHLDLHNKIEIMMLLKKIAAQGKGILISTHDLQISLQLSDSMCLFNFNEPVTEGIPEDLVLDGSFQKTLFLDNFKYDFKTGRFSTGQLTPRKAIKISGERDAIFWTQHALEKLGYEIVDHKDAELLTIEGSSWRYTKNDISHTFHNIENLLSFLS